ncbi:MAG TPA: hypothetical protein VFS43_23240 [Polyangiaceae bacterium]|nr:hypothetical protein [Polyangiaceae bacterium]
MLIASPVSDEDVQSFAKHARAVVGQAKRPLVFCTDLRRARVFPQSVADALVWVMRMDNPNSERNGLLLADRSLFARQVERMRLEAKGANRRAFYQRDELAAWLEPLLEQPERERLALFLAEGDGPPSLSPPATPAQ